MNKWNGYPPEPEKSGWHWLHYCGEDAPEPGQWFAKRQQWENAAGFYNPETIAFDATYHGPVVFAPNWQAGRADAFRCGAFAVWHKIQSDGFVTEVDIEALAAKEAQP